MAKSNIPDVPVGTMSDDDFDALQEECHLKPINQFKYEIRYLMPKDIHIDWKLQSRENTTGKHLISSILDTGLNTNLEAWLNALEEIWLLRGHQRIMALIEILKLHPKEFKRLFPNGIPVKVYLGITSNDALRIRADHSYDKLKKPLTSKIEAVNMTTPLYQNGFSEKQVMVMSFDTVVPIMASPKTYNDLIEKRNNAKTSRDFRDILFNSQKGSFQFLKRISEAPPDLVDFWKDGERGKQPMFPKRKQYEELVMVFNNAVKADRKSDDPKGYGYDKLPPEYVQAFADAKKALISGTVVTEGTTKVKPMSKKDRDEMQEKIAQSKCAILTVSLCSGNATAKPAWAIYDQFAKRCELAAEVDEPLTEMVIKAITARKGVKLDDKATKQLKAILTIVEEKPKTKAKS
jgi:hypothetical protein